ncbi:MAG: transketolase C-terminal domain-containing protein [Clostridiaceae bacterium]|nr:transketolase C-terminal domain-containing protein [Clostridiaceae bacterium]
MSVIVKSNLEKAPIEMRSAMCATLVELAKENANIVAMDADTLGSSGLKPFMKAFPNRYIDCGIEEANMIGVAAGMSAVGKIPFVHSFGPFVSRRVYDQVFLSCAYAKLNVKIIGSDPGVTAAYNGGTHMPFEDMGILRLVPTITLIEPSDEVQLVNLLPQVANMYGTVYIRLKRKNAVTIYEEGSTFEIGKAALLRPGRDVTLIASGIMVAQALKAAAALADMGIDARVVDSFTWKPLDEACVTACAKETGAIVTCENHNIVGGLGGAVSEAVCAAAPVPVERVGIPDIFGEVGTEAWLTDRFQLTPDAIVAAAKKAVARK